MVFLISLHHGHLYSTRKRCWIRTKLNGVFLDFAELITPSDEALLWAMAYQGYKIMDAEEGIQ